MPGPVRSAATVSATDEDNWEQVLVAAFPGTTPEVHVASLNPVKGVLVLREATVRGVGNISLGRERRVDLAHAGSVESSDGIVAILNRSGELVVQMHLESEEEQVTWAKALNLVVSQFGSASARSSPKAGQSKATANSASASSQKQETTNGSEDELVMLRARSQQLQTRIGSLEAISQRRDRQLQKLLKRLDGAMQMLAAVQDMCMQQRKVIQAQEVAIAELRKESGEEVSQEADAEDEEEEEEEEEEEAVSTRKPEATATEAQRKEALAEAEAEMAAKAGHMLMLLQQADELQRALAQLEALEASGELETSPPGVNGTVTRPTEEDEEDENNDDGDDDGEDGEDGEDAEVVLDRLHTLQEEKSRFEGMLRDSQQEHEDLLDRLESMRTLMTSLGLSMPDDDEEEDG